MDHRYAAALGQRRVISAGRLRERVAIQEKNLVPNGKGGRKRPENGPEWIGKGQVRAEIVPLRGDEALFNSIPRAVQLYRVTFRWRPGLTAADRLLWSTRAGDVALTINSPPTQSSDGRDLVMTCESGVPG